jgi:orotate phosphoribosyltransferase
VLSTYAEKSPEPPGFKFTRGYDEAIRGKSALVVEDNISTGGSVKKVVELVRATGGEAVGATSMVNQGNVTREDVGNVPFKSLLHFFNETWLPEECPLCAKGIPINRKVGKGKNLAST